MAASSKSTFQIFHRFNINIYHKKRKENWVTRILVHKEKCTISKFLLQCQNAIQILTLLMVLVTIPQNK